MRRRSGFSLVEVVLAIGVFLITVLALVGLIGPTLKSVEDVERADEVTSVVNAVNAFLQSRAEIDPNGSAFEVVYNAVASNNEATIFVYRYFDPSDDRVALEVGFSRFEAGGQLDPRGVVNQPASNPAAFSLAAGPIYRVVLTASSVIPLNPTPYRSSDRNGAGIFTLAESNVDNYPLGYLALEVRIFAQDPPGPNGTFDEATDLNEWNDTEPLFVYNTAIVR
jgi:type II secretory pathway pseudopilin PulG